MTTGLLIVLLVIAGLLLWLVPNIDPVVKKIIYVVLIVATVVWLLAVLGVWGGLRVGRF